MTFVQEYTRFDYFTGDQTVRFVMSDNYSDLFKSQFDEGDGVPVDIYSIGTAKLDLNTDDGGFAVDELSFEIDQAACRTENEIKAMFFVLDAASTEVGRYCAVFFGAPSVDTMLFVGRVLTKNSGDDAYWDSGLYGYEINPIRKYKFTAQSFDLKILEDCTFTKPVYSNLATDDLELIDNIETRLRREDVFNPLYDQALHRIAYVDPPLDGCRDLAPYVFYRPLLNLFMIVQTILNLSTELLHEKHNYSLNFTLLKSFLDFQTMPVSYTFEEAIEQNGDKSFDQFFMRVVKYLGPKGSPVKLKLTDEESTSDFSPVFVHRRLFDTRFGLSDIIDNGYVKYDDNSDSVRSARSEDTLSILGLANTSDLLFELARALGCYVVLRYTTGTDVNVEFVSRQSLVDPDYTYIVGATDASYDTSALESKDSNIYYYGLANNLARDGYDIVLQKRINDVPAESTLSKALKDEIDVNKSKKKMEPRRLLLTTSPTLLHYYFSSERQSSSFRPKLYKVPFNTVRRSSTDMTKSASDYSPVLIYPNENQGSGESTEAKERLHSAIYINTLPPESEQATLLGAGVQVFRPAYTILTKINNKDRSFSTLSEYISEVTGTDKQFYETEYELTIPSWNGFSKNTNGSDASWKNLKLGSKIKLSETVKRYQGSQWVESLVSKDYVVVGIEIDLNKPQTKLKLHNIDRFAYGYWEGLNVPQNSYNSGGFDLVKAPVSTNDNFKYFTVDTDETILTGDAVAQLSNGNIAKALNVKSQGYIIGIAVEAGEGSQSIMVQLEGEVYCNDYNFTSIGQQVFARRSIESHHFLNISESLLSAPTEGEDQIAIMGVSTSAKSFKLDINVLTWANNAGGA